MSDFDVTATASAIHADTVQQSEDDRHSQMLDATRRFEAMNEEQAQQVFDRLAEDGTLPELVRDVADHDSGLSADEQKALFTALASKLSGEQLAKLADTVEKIDANAMDTLAEVLTQTSAASPDTQAEFLRHYGLKTGLGPVEGSRERTFLGMKLKVTSVHEDPRAVLAAGILHALSAVESSQPAFLAAVQTLQRSGSLDTVLAAGLGRSGVKVDFLEWRGNFFYDCDTVALQAVLMAAPYADGVTQGALLCATDKVLSMTRTGETQALCKTDDPLDGRGLYPVLQAFNKLNMVTPRDPVLVPCDVTRPRTPDAPGTSP